MFYFFQQIVIKLMRSEAEPVLIKAIQSKMLNKITFLLECDINPNEIDYEGNTPLHWVIYCGYVDFAHLLLEKNANPNIQNAKGWTPLHWAAQKGYEELVILFLKNNALVNIQTDSGNTPLHRAALHGNTAIVQLLLSAGADPCVKTQHYRLTPLHWAAENGFDRIVKLLLKKNIDFNVKDADNATPLHKAAKNGHAKVVALLIKADVSFDVKNIWGETPLHLAVCRKPIVISTVALLLSKGADYLVKNPCNNKNSLDFFKKEQKKEIKEQITICLIKQLKLTQDKTVAAEVYFRLGQQEKACLQILSRICFVDNAEIQDISNALNSTLLAFKYIWKRAELLIEIRGLICAHLFADIIFEVHPLLGSFSTDHQNVDSLQGPFVTLLGCST